MSTVVHLHDPADERLADYRALNDAALRARHEHDQGVFIAEGAFVVARLLQSPLEVVSVLVTPKRLADLASVLDPIEAVVYVVAPEVMRDIVGFDLHRGVVACGRRPPSRPAPELLAAARCVAVLEGLNDHENLGALFRSASALGVDAVLLDPTCADPWYRRCVRVSMGEVMAVPFARVDHLRTVGAAGFTTVALMASGSVDLADLRIDGPVAIALGSEGAGLSRSWIDAAHVQARIAIREGVDSLNVAAAAAIAFHRLARP